MEEKIETEVMCMVLGENIAILQTSGDEVVQKIFMNLNTAKGLAESIIEFVGK